MPQVSKGLVPGTSTHPLAYGCELSGASDIFLYGLSSTAGSGAHGDLGPSPPWWLFSHSFLHPWEEGFPFCPFQITAVTEEVRAREDEGSHKHRPTTLKSQRKPKQGSGRPPWPWSAPSETVQNKPFVVKQEFMTCDYKDPVETLGNIDPGGALSPSVFYSHPLPSPWTRSAWRRELSGSGRPTRFGEELGSSHLRSPLALSPPPAALFFVLPCQAHPPGRYIHGTWYILLQSLPYLCTSHH